MVRKDRVITREVLQNFIERHPEILDRIDQPYKKTAYVFYVQKKKPKDLEPLLKYCMDGQEIIRRTKYQILLAAFWYMYEEFEKCQE